MRLALFVTQIYRILLLLGLAVAAFSQNNFSQCDVNHDGTINVLDAQAMIGQGLGSASPANDFSGVGVVNVLDIQDEMNAIIYNKCPYYSVTPRFAVINVSLLNQAWIPADIPSAGNLTSNYATVLSVSLLNQAWIPADIPSPGNLTSNFANALSVTLVNQAWISADIPSPGDVGFVAGLLVSLNNTATSAPSITGLGVKVLGGGWSTAPVDLASVNNGDALIVGHTIRFRVHPPEALTSSDFMINGARLRVHAPLEMLFTAPANASAFDLQAVIYVADGRVWRTPAKHLLIVPDPGLALSGRAVRADGSPAASTAVGVRANGLAAEYFRADRALASWSDLDRPADKRGYVTAVNQPDTIALGPDPFGTGFSSAYATRFRGEILVSLEGQHQFFLDAPLGMRLIVDGAALMDAPPGAFSPESQATISLTAGWHTIEVDSYQTASRPSLQLSWRQPNSGREVVRPEALAIEIGPLAVTDANGAFGVEWFPTILNPLEWHPVPADSHVRIILDQSVSEERPRQQ
jgi:hypothetical protein